MMSNPEMHAAVLPFPPVRAESDDPCVGLASRSERNPSRWPAGTGFAACVAPDGIPFASSLLVRQARTAGSKHTAGSLTGGKSGGRLQDRIEVEPS